MNIQAPQRPEYLSVLESAARDIATPLLPAASTRQSRWDWLRHWEFWLILALGGFLRLWHLDVAQFTFANDQRDFMTLARDAFTLHVFPVTGIISSITTLNPPLSVYLIMPFTLFTPSPMPEVIFIALWNTFGLAACYVFALRFFPRPLAVAGTLLFATCGEAVDLSRFLWQQNFITPLLVLWAITLYWGCVAGSDAPQGASQAPAGHRPSGAAEGRRWFVPNVTLLTLGALLHPTVLLLAPVTLVAVLLAPTLPSKREWGLAGLIGLVLLAPTIVWEVISRGSDIRLLAHYVLRGHAVINTQVFHALRQAVGSPTFPGAGIFTPYAHVLPTSPYARLFSVQSRLEALALLLYALGYIVLTAIVLLPALPFVRTPALAGERRWLRVARDIWSGLRADARWRAYLLLWLWVTIPVVLLIRHSSDVFAHYLLVLYPGIFLVGGLAVDRLLVAVTKLAPMVASAVRVGSARMWGLAGQGVIVLVTAVLLVGQATLCVVYVTTLASGQFDANDGYGYTMGEFLNADQALGDLQRQQQASAIYLSAPGQYYHDAVQYLLVGEHPDRMSFYGDCLILPPVSSGPALVVATDPNSRAAAFLPTLPNVQYVSTMSLPGGDPFTVYRFAGGLPSLPDETPLAPVEYHDAAGGGLRLDAASVASDGELRLRWTVLGSTPNAATPIWYRAEERAGGQSATAAATAATPAALASSSCEPTRWQAGETLFTWLTPPSPSGASTQTPAFAPASGSVGVDVLGYTSHFDMPSLGPVRLLAGSVTGDPPARLPTAFVSGPAGSGGPENLDGGVLTLRLDALAHT